MSQVFSNDQLVFLLRNTELSLREIATALGVGKSSVSERMDRNGWTMTKRHLAGLSVAQIVDAVDAEDSEAPAPKKARTKAPAPELAPVDPDVAGLLATGGRYAALADGGQSRGLTAKQALQRWHQMRVPVRRGSDA